MSCTARLVGGGSPDMLVPIDAETAARHDGPGFIWIHAEGGDLEGLAALKRFDRLPDIAASALVAEETRPRCDRVGNGAIINLRGDAAGDAGSDRLVSIRFWVDGRRVYSVTRRPLAAMPSVEALAAAGKIADPGDLIAAFARSISADLDPEVAALGDRLDDCETALEPRHIYRLRSEIAALRSEAIGLRRFIAPDRDALLTLAGLDMAWLGEDDRLHIREAADRFARMAEELEAVRERAALLHEQLTDLRAEQLDGRALVIAIVALIFLPLTFVTGLFGMNVDGIPFAHAPGAFWTITGLSIAAALGLAYWFARIHWLGR